MNSLQTATHSETVPVQTSGNGSFATEKNLSNATESPQCRPIGEILVHSGLITREQLSKALAEQSVSGGRIGEILIRNRWITPQAFEKTLKDSGKKIRLGEILIERKVITPEQLTEALEHHKTRGKPLGEALVDLGFIEEHLLLSTISRQLGIQYLDVSKDDFAIIDPELRDNLSAVDKRFWADLRSLPVFLSNRPKSKRIRRRIRIRMGCADIFRLPWPTR